MESQIQKITNETIKEMESNGALKSIVQKHVEAAINKSVDDLFGWNSEFRKGMEKYLSENVTFRPEHVSLPLYNEFIKDSMTKKISTILGDQSQKLIDDMVKSVVGLDSFDKKEYRLDDFIKEVFKRGHVEFDKDEVEWEDRPYVHISLHVEIMKSLTFIHFDPESGKEKYQCKHSLTLETETGLIESVRVKFGPNVKWEDQFLINCRYQGVKITQVHDTQEEEYSIDATDLVESCLC